MQGVDIMVIALSNKLVTMAMNQSPKCYSIEEQMSTHGVGTTVVLLTRLLFEPPSCTAKKSPSRLYKCYSIGEQMVMHQDDTFAMLFKQLPHMATSK